jgi:integrase/recombinase XerD
MVELSRHNQTKEDTMGQLRERMEADLRLAGYSPSTKKIYLLYAKLFVKYHMRSPAEMGEDQIREYLLHMVEEEQVSRETYRQIRAALIFLYTVTLKRQTEVQHLPVRRKRVKLPVVLSGTEVQALLDAIHNPKYRAIVMALYAGGLRISEACRLQSEDIDSKRMVIHVRAGKGGRDRYTVLSQRLLVYLRDYFRTFRPLGWLFPGQTADGHASPETSRRVFHTAVASAGISKMITPHTLRHCFATHLLETGVDISVIQALLGHGSLRTTEVYTHVSVEHIGRVRSPLDLLGTPAAKPLG